MRYQILLLDIPDELHHALEHRFQGININFIILFFKVAVHSRRFKISF